MRKGMTLIELLFACSVIFVLMGLTSPLFLSIANQLPKKQRAIQENWQLENMLQKLKDDVGNSKSLEFDSKSNVLVLKGASGQIKYNFNRPEFTRTGSDGKQIAWPLTIANLNCKPWLKNGKTVGLEIQTWVSIVEENREFKKLRNSHLYFLGVMEGQ